MAAALGFAPVPAPADKLQLGNPGAPAALSLEDLQPLPDTELVRLSKQHLESILPKPVWNHSHRSYLFAFVRSGFLCDLL